METEAIIAIGWIVTAALSVVAFYVVGAMAVARGMKAHSVWRAEGGLEATLDKRTEKRDLARREREMNQ
jgi:hypothetical protein